MNTKLEKAIAHILGAQNTLENMPCGGVGKDGATQDELYEVANNGHHYAQDATYHQAQQAWLELEKALSLLRTIKLMDK